MKRSKTDARITMTHLEEEVLAVVRTTVMNHDKVWLHYPSLIAQLDESRHWVLACTQIKGHNEMKQPTEPGIICVHGGLCMYIYINTKCNSICNYEFDSFKS